MKKSKGTKMAYSTETQLSTHQSTRSVTRVFMMTAIAVSGLAILAAAVLMALPKNKSLTPAQRALATELRLASGHPKADSNLAHQLYRASLNPAGSAGSSLRDPINSRSSHAAPSSLSDIFIETDELFDQSSIEDLGVVIGTQAGQVMTATAPLQIIPELLGLPGITRVTAAAVMQEQSNVSIPEIDANDAWQGTPPNFGAEGLRGEGVIVGIVDSGIDYTNPDFKNPDGTTRILSAWDHTWNEVAFPPPPGLPGYGAEYSNAQINAGLADEFKDYSGHGTNVAGIAASNGRNTGFYCTNGSTAHPLCTKVIDGTPTHFPEAYVESEPYRYMGVAPKADLVIVKTTNIETRVVDGCKYIFLKAASLQKPAVCNISLTSIAGPRDGTHAFEKLLSALTGPGKIITTGMGNEGPSLAHASTNLAAAAQTDIGFVIPTYTPSQNFSETITVEGWYAANASFDVQLLYTPPLASEPQFLLPIGGQTPIPALAQFTQPGTSTGYVQTQSGTVLIQNGMSTNAEPINSPRYAKNILISVAYGTPGTPRPASGTWTIRLKRRTEQTVTSGLSDWWITTIQLATTSKTLFSGPNANSEKTLLSPAAADSLIVTGAYGSKYSWASAAGSTTRYAGTTDLTKSPPAEFPTGRFADFSSRGPRRDNVVRPDVAAPGYGVMSSTSSHATITPTYKEPDAKHDIRKGTSQASAHTAGVIALILQEYKKQGITNLCPDGTGLQPNGDQCHPTLTLRQILRSRVRQDAFTTVHPCPTAAAGTCALSSTLGNPNSLAIPNQFYGYGKLGTLPVAPGGDQTPEPIIRRR